VSPTRRVFLGLGSNLGDRWLILRQAVGSLPAVAAVSDVYETDPVGGPPDQPPYLNLVVELATDLPARRLLELAQRLEADAGRDRSQAAVRFGPRTLDVDILLVGAETVNDPDLVVPHPRMFERRFVLQPLADLAPELLPSDWEENAKGSVRRLGRLPDLDWR
jgi:2-amino-4-hydroxy-6-hydroxymethyldihydropteridine diphosphokinase